MPEGVFVPRLTSEGMRGNPYWYSRNPFYQTNNGLPNCTCYAWGRFWECSDIDHNFSNRPLLGTGNAEDWYNYNDGYERGSTPALGAVLCLADGPYSGWGHVAIVEEILPDMSIRVSESNWGGLYFDTAVYHPPHYLKAAGYRFQGFIYNPIVGGGPWWRNKIWMFKRALWHKEEELIK